MVTELTVRFDYGSMLPWVRQVEDGLRMVAGPDSVHLATEVRMRATDRAHRGEFLVSAGDRVPFVLTWQASHLPPPSPVDAEQALRDTETRVEDWVARLPLRRRVARRGDPVAARPQGADLRPDRRDRRGGDHLAAGGDRRRTQLGLPVLLAARRHDDAAGAALRRLHRRGQGLARVAAAGGRRRPPRDADHVRDRRRAAARRSTSCRGCPATRARRRSGSATRRPASSSSTCTASCSTRCTWTAPPG